MHSTGSSYLLRQSPGAEQFGGASVKVCPKRGDTGSLHIRLTDFRTHEMLGDDAEFLRGISEKAYERFVRDYMLANNDWDVEIFDFAYHPIDTGERTVHVAVYNALVSAFAAWDHTLAIWSRRRG
ncbi:MAG: hypothetical protein J0M26_00605 [Planctomycetes bacterium]|nr:hypothetical protein [Planctomycetota bacterium]